MAIPEHQLETWSNQGAVTTSKTTHERIRSVINNSTVFSGKDYEVYLQGSYKNSTNIRGDSDVDIVVQLKSTFYHNINTLSKNESDLFHATHSDATYGFMDFKSDLITLLKDYYGNNSVKVGNKSIKIIGGNGRLPADVVPCAQYRHYKRFTGIGEKTDYVEGIYFLTTNENRKVINYPKEHYNYGVEKNQATNQKYKQLIRIFKNARTYMDQRDLFDKSLAPGYFVEGLLFNVPNEKFNQRTYQSAFLGILNWLYENAITRVNGLSGFTCQNKQVSLFGNSQEQWNTVHATDFYSALVQLWNDWGK